MLAFWDTLLLYVAILACVCLRLLLGLVLVAVLFTCCQEWVGLGITMVFIALGFWAKIGVGE